MEDGKLFFRFAPHSDSFEVLLNLNCGDVEFYQAPSELSLYQCGCADSNPLSQHEYATLVAPHVLLDSLRSTFAPQYSCELPGLSAAEERLQPRADSIF